MPILRNPFRKTPADQYVDETAFPGSRASERNGTSFESGSSGTKPLSVRPNGRPAPTEYKLSEINDSGVFIPPSPPEAKSSFWSTRSGTSTRSSSHRSVLNENEPFNISRESFDSYRRSFDISARSPVLESTQRGRQSLDARRVRLPPSSHSQTGSPKNLQMTPALGGQPTEGTNDFQPRRPSATPYQPAQLIGLTDKHINPPTSQPEEPENPHPAVPEEESDVDAQIPAKTAPTRGGDRFEDVGLGDDAANPRNVRKGAPQPPTHHQFPSLHTQATKKPGIFSRFTAGGSAADAPVSSANPADGSNSRPNSSGIGLGLGSSSHHGLFGRKRGGSGQGAELGSVHTKRSSVVAAPSVSDV